MTDKIFNILFEQDEVTWQALLMDLVKSGEMDPWDIDISELTHKYIDMVKKLKEANLRVSGKVLLAAAILLRIKSTKLLTDDIGAFDMMLSDSEDQMLLEQEGINGGAPIDRAMYKNLRLYPRTPQPRKRKVSIYDLIDALQKALEVSRRRTLRNLPPPNLVLPEKKVDIHELIEKLHQQIKDWFSTKDERLTFDHLLPEETRSGKIYTFVPLLHLTNARHIDLEQKEHLGEISITEAGKKPQPSEDAPALT